MGRFLPSLSPKVFEPGQHRPAAPLPDFDRQRRAPDDVPEPAAAIREGDGVAFIPLSEYGVLAGGSA
jgi:hypothetical protein